MVFFRVGSMVMVMPGLGEAAVPPRIRLSFALLLLHLFISKSAIGNSDFKRLHLEFMSCQIAFELVNAVF